MARSLTTFCAGIAMCIVIKPAGLSANDGLSYFGVYGETIIPYALGLLGGAYFITRALGQLPPKEKMIRISLRTYVFLITGIVITPYAAGPWMDHVHTTIGAALFSLQLTLSCYLLWRLKYVWWSVLLSLSMLTSGLLSLIYLAPTHGYLLQSQIIFQISFDILMILSLQALGRAVSQRSDIDTEGHISSL